MNRPTLLNFPPLLNTALTKRADEMFRMGRDTSYIGAVLNVSEAHVANSIHRLRELRWLQSEAIAR